MDMEILLPRPGGRLEKYRLAQLEPLPNAAGDPSVADRTWVLLTEAVDGGWGLSGHANTNAELVAAARAQIAEITANQKSNS